ncbi:MAG: glycosyltransferase, partial [Kiritimatiellia bacterium]|nr:glycosyltransferase [Kiritimatiellia bacterium]
LLQPRDMLLRYQVGPRLSNWVKSFAPDIIYTQPSSICHMSLARQIQMLSGAKMAIHIMDDWPMLFMQPDMSHRLRARKTLDLFQQMIDHSSLRLTISNKMAKEYQRRYGCEFIPFHNPAILEERYADLPSAEKSPPPLKIIYSGGISSRNQLSALKTICQSIGLLNKSGLSVEFHIYTHPRWQALYSKELQFEHVLFKPYVSDQAEISRIYRESELLIIPLSFDRESLKYVSLSMPTKVSSYMASGTPILVYASPETAFADYAKEEGWAFVVSEPQEEGLRRMLHLALTSDEMRKQYRERALTVVKENHEAQAVQKKFQSLLLSVGDHRVV